MFEYTYDADADLCCLFSENGALMGEYNCLGDLLEANPELDKGRIGAFEDRCFENIVYMLTESTVGVTTPGLVTLEELAQMELAMFAVEALNSMPCNGRLADSGDAVRNQYTTRYTLSSHWALPII